MSKKTTTNTYIQKKGLNRNTTDKFYTKNEIVKICVDKIIENLDINKDDLIIEPSAGNGAFINEIKKLSNNYKFFDIEPDNKEIKKKDYLTIDSEKYKKNYENIHIIGNPPFGRQSSTAIKFIKKSCEYSNSISFILPKSFKKDSMKNYFDKYFHLIFEMDLPQKSFLCNKNEYDVPCVFQIWQKKDNERNIQKKIEPNKFSFVKKNDSPDISFRRVGVYAGNISKEILDKSIQSHYFIKFDDTQKIKDKDEKIDEIIDKLKNINFQTNNTVGPKSISKQEIIKEFNNIL
jgi:hypothetical protein